MKLYSGEYNTNHSPVPSIFSVLSSFGHIYWLITNGVDKYCVYFVDFLSVSNKIFLIILTTAAYHKQGLLNKKKEKERTSIRWDYEQCYGPNRQVLAHLVAGHPAY